MTSVQLKGILVGIKFQIPNSDWTIEESIEELEELSKTADITIIEKLIQNRDTPHNKHYIGKGKLEEIQNIIKINAINILITDDDLTPNQHKNLEKILNIKVLDRTGLILDIFAKHAKTFESKLQIELAQLNYLLPRLTRLWTHLSRLGGGIGTRGPGEKQIEVDKRQINKRIHVIKQKLIKVKQTRDQQRSNRQTLPIITGSILGYTNAGKSTLMNTLTNSNVLAEDKLFATLDPKTRKFLLPNKDEIVLSDTVGFIQKLPHHLVKAFLSTLEEVTFSDFILHIIDASHPNCIGMINTANEIIKSLNSDNKPILYVLNKSDKIKKPNQTQKLLENYQPQIYISALNKTNIHNLNTEIENLLNNFQKIIKFSLNYNQMDIINLIHKHGTILESKYEETIKLTVKINSIVGEKILTKAYQPKH
ncbi:GTPase HflX [Candidatus Marinamargulisbacteria bacterium SCGC AG-410-N11]|nr:GTPase HflX [Candidatus Marinamargulisbacteria bacterium SCGC AG-410-N11]